MAVLPDFSIITPSFNQLGLLADCVASVAAQAQGGIRVEHIVQDAGTPGIEALAHALGAEFYCGGKLQEAPSGVVARPAPSPYSLQIHCEPDTGMYDAINKGLLKSSGRFCAWLNCDEQYVLGTLPLAALFFEKYPKADAIFGDMVVTDAAGKPLCYRRGIVQNPQLLAFSALNISSCTLFFRRWLVGRRLVLDPTWKVVGDKEWIVRLLREGVRFRPLKKLVACFRLLPDSLTASRLATEEGERLGRLLGIPSPAQKIALISEQVLRKIAAGCYWPRWVDVRLHAASGKICRVGPAWVGFRWPASTRG